MTADPEWAAGNLCPDALAHQLYEKDIYSMSRKCLHCALSAFTGYPYGGIFSRG